MVFAYHMWQFSGSPRAEIQIGTIVIDPMVPIAAGFSGVDIFIVVSGLCLFLPYVDRDRPWSARGYATRRLWRIIPPYYSAILFLTLLPLVLVAGTRLLGRSSSNWQELPTIANLVTHLTFTQTWFVDQWDSIQGALWTIGLEAQLYVVFPFVLLAYRRWGLRVIWFGIAISILFRVAVSPWVADWGFPRGFLLTITVPGRWMQFGTGMLLAWLLHIAAVETGKSGSRTIAMFDKIPKSFWIPASVVIFLVATSEVVSALDVLPVRDSLLAASTACLVIGSCLTSSRLAAPLRWRPVALFGLISYSFYLLHQNTGWYISEFGIKFLHLSPWLQFLYLLTVGGSIIGLLALLFYRYIERPTTKRGKVLARKVESKNSIGLSRTSQRST